MILKRRVNPLWWYASMSFLATLFLWCILFWLLGLAPFGTQIIYFSDLGAQYLPFMSALKEMFFSGDGILYSFHNGIGGNMVPLSAYYLTSPLNLLTLFFSHETMPVALHFLMMLKSSLAAVAMSVYLWKTFHKETFMIILLSQAYALCGFTAAYFYNIMWLDALIWLPITTLALQYLLDTGKPLPYIFSLFLTIWSNYYLGYMVCLFLLSYSVYWLYKEAYHDKGRRFLSFVGSSLVAAMLTGILLVPTAFGMLSTGKGDFSLDIFAPRLMYGIDGLAGFGTGVSDFANRLDHLPTFYSSLLGLLLAGGYFLNPKIERKAKKVRLFFLGWLMLGTWFQPILLVFQAFQPAAGFPYRNSFLVSFFVLVLAFESWIRRKGFPQKRLHQLAVGFATMFIAAYFVDWVTDQQLKVEMLVLSLAFLMIVTWLFTKRKRTYFVALLGIVLMVDVSVNFWATIQGSSFTDYADYQAYVRTVEASLEEREDPFMRVDNTNLNAREWGVDTNGYNEGIQFRYPGVASYTSTLSAESLALYQQFGLYSRNERRISYVGSTPWTDFLLNVGYRFEQEELQQTNHAGGVGFLIPAGKRPTLSANPFENQDKTFQAAFQTDESLFVPVATVDVEEDETPTTVTVETSATGPLYVWLGTELYQDVRVAGESIAPKFGMDEEMLLPVGDYQEGETVTIQLESENAVAFSVLNFQTFRMDEFTNTTSMNPVERLSEVFQDGNGLTGEITATAASTLVLSIPHEAGWQVTVNGEKVEPAPVMGGFMGIPLLPGNHVVAASYTPPGMVTGAVLTLTGMVASMGIGYYQHKRNKK